MVIRALLVCLGWDVSSDWINLNWLKAINMLGIGKDAYKDNTVKAMKNFKGLTENQYATLTTLVSHPNFTADFMRSKGSALLSFTNWIIAVYE